MFLGEGNAQLSDNDCVVIMYYQQHDRTPVNRAARQNTQTNAAKGQSVKVPGTCSVYSLTCD